MSSTLSSRRIRVTRERKFNTEDGNPRSTCKHRLKMLRQESMQKKKQTSDLTNLFLTLASWLNISNLSPEQQVINMPHLVKKILRASTLPDVLSMRFVSNHMNSSAIDVIQDKTALHFGNDFRIIPNAHSRTHLANLNQLMRKPRSWQFPVRRFSFTTFTHIYYIQEVLKDLTALHPFLQLYGSHISHLSLQLTKMKGSWLVCESKVISDIKNLLLLVPNLEEFLISYECNVKWIRKGKNDTSALCLKDPEWLELHSTKNVVRNSKLKVLKLGAFVSAKLCELIIIRSPNLVEVQVLNNPSHKIFLLEPCSRIHLLKSICVTNKLDDFQMYENLIRQLQMDKGANVRSVVIQVLMKDSMTDTLDLGQINRFVKIVNDLLELVAEALEELSWIGVAPLNSLKWPAVMTKVKRLRLQTLCRMEDLIENSENYPSQEFKILSKLPGLRVVSFSDFLEDEFPLLANSLVENTLLSVQDFDYSCRVSVGVVRADNQEMYKLRFPNARISCSYEHFKN